MKNQLLKPLFILFGLLFVVGCQENFINEENISTELEQSRKLIFDYKTIDYVIKEESALRKSVQKIQQNKKDLTSSVYNFSFDENKVQIMQDSTYTQYTFLIKRDNPTDYMVENYICRVYENDSVQQFITSYPVIDTQDSLEIDYSSGNFQEIHDDAIDISKSLANCVPVIEQVEVEVTVPCTDPEGANHTDPGNCNCDDLDFCEPPTTQTEIATIVTWDCGGGESDSGDDNSGPDNNDPGGTPNGGGSGNGNSNPVNEPVLTDPVEPELLLKLPVREYFENLDDDKKDCYENSGLNGMGTGTGSGLNSMIDDIEEFLNENTTNGVTDPEAQAFADAILEDCDSSQDVDFEKQLIKDPSLPECVNNIIDKLILDDEFVDLEELPDFIEQELNLSGHILDVFNNSDNYHLKFMAVDLPNNVNSKTNYNNSTLGYDIKLNTDYISNATDLALARTIIHESLHAYISFIYATEFDSGLSQSLRHLLSQNNDEPNTSQHILMTQEFVLAIAISLSRWDDNAITSDPAFTNGNLNFMNNYYFQLSWSGGMLDTEAFDALPNDTQQDIQAANVAEGQAINMATDDANGVKNCN